MILNYVLIDVNASEPKEFSGLEDIFKLYLFALLFNLHRTLQLFSEHVYIILLPTNNSVFRCFLFIV